MNNNINDCNDSNCSSCGACAAVCPKEAIELHLDVNGFYKPLLIDTKCISCGICKSFCIKFDDKIEKTKINNIDCYSGINKNKEILKECSSGAISEEIMKECIKNGYSIIAVEYDYKNDIAKHTICKSAQSLYKYRGSKYFQSYTVDALKEVIRNKDKKYAIFGTPCQIYALKKYSIKFKLDNLLLIDIFCHGIPSMYLWKSYISKFKKPFKKVSFRTKDYGWHNFSFLFVDNNGKKRISSKTNDRFYDLFFSKLCFNEACYACELRSTIEYCDIRLGDFWGKKYSGNYEGVSAIIVRTQKGKEILNSIKNNLELKQEQYEEIIDAQSYGKKRTIDRCMRNKMIDTLKKQDIEDAYLLYCGTLSLKDKVIKMVKNLVKKMPKKIQFRLRGKI